MIFISHSGGTRPVAQDKVEGNIGTYCWIIQTLMARVSDIYYKNESSVSTNSRPPNAKYDAFLHPRKLEIFVRCSDLTQLDTFSKSDPLCVLFLKRLGQWSEYGRTESIPNNLNPRVSKLNLYSVHVRSCPVAMAWLYGGVLGSKLDSIETRHPKPWRALNCYVRPQFLLRSLEKR